MSRPKRQHYLPQFFLRNFQALGERERVWILDKLKGEIRLQAIRESAHENRFYEQSDVMRIGLDLEGQLASFESGVAPILAEIIQNRSLLSVTAEARAAIIDFTLVQLFRTRAAREFAKQGSRILLNREISEEVAQQATIAILIRDFPKYRDLCSHHILTLREIVSPERIVLGDAGTLLIRTVVGPKNSLSEILPTATICLPVSPSLALMLFSGVCEADLAEAGVWYKPEIRVLTEAQPAESGDTSSFNTMSVIAANRFVYSATRDFSDCNEVIDGNPRAAYGPIGGWEETRNTDKNCL